MFKDSVYDNMDDVFYALHYTYHEGHPLVAQITQRLMNELTDSYTSPGILNSTYYYTSYGKAWLFTDKIRADELEAMLKYMEQEVRL